MRATEYFVHACDPKTLVVRQIMEDAVVRVSPGASAMHVAEVLSDHTFGSLPVVEADGTLRGLVTEFDLLRAVEQGHDLRNITQSNNWITRCSCALLPIPLPTQVVVTIRGNLLFRDYQPESWLET
ncbi:CBS domain-containing protein, partial [Nitrospirales bacterium NOB]|nr:CBS domain-containing protein [Nitrospirales bacterium NOB]